MTLRWTRTLALAMAGCLAGCLAEPARQFTFATEIAITFVHDAKPMPAAADFEAVEQAWQDLARDMTRDPRTMGFLQRELASSVPLAIHYSHDVSGLEPPANGAALCFADVANADDPMAWTETRRGADGCSVHCKRMVAIGWVGHGVALRHQGGGTTDLRDLFATAAIDHLSRHLEDWSVQPTAIGR